MVSQNGHDRAGQAAGGDRRRVLAQLAAQARHDAVDLRGEAVDDAGADRVDGRLADQRCAARARSILGIAAARLVSASSEISTPGAMIPPRYSPAADTQS